MARNGVRILEDENVLNQFKIQAKEQAMKFSLEAILPQYEELYDEVLERFSAPQL